VPGACRVDGNHLPEIPVAAARNKVRRRKYLFQLTFLARRV